MIEIHIGKDKLDHHGHETLVGRRLIESLRQAGVPVVGEFAIRGVTKGTLIYQDLDELDGVMHSFKWLEDDKDKPTGKPVRTQLKNGSVVYKTGRHAEDDEL